MTYNLLGCVKLCTVYICAALRAKFLCVKKCHLTQNTQYSATRTTRDGSELTVSRSSITLHSRYHQHACAICKEIEALRYIQYIAYSGASTALFNDALRF